MIHQNLLTLRKMHQWTQEEVAEKIDVSRQAVAKWEAGETVPDLHHCNALAKLYNVTIDDLLNFAADEKGISIPPKGKHLFGTVRVGDQGEIVLPKQAMRIFALKPGDELIVLGDEEQGIALLKAEVVTEFMNAVEQSRKDK